MFQTKEQVKTPETELNERKISDIPKKRVQINHHKNFVFAAHQGQENNAWTKWEFKEKDRKYLRSAK